MKNISGKWSVQKSLPLLGFGEGYLIVYSDGLAKGCGKMHFLGKDYQFNADSIQIKAVEPGIYQGTYGGKTITLTLNSLGTHLNTSFNPYRLGVVKTKRLDFNIPLQFSKA